MKFRQRSGSSHHTTRESTGDEITMINDISTEISQCNKFCKKWVELRKKECSVTEVYTNSTCKFMESGFSNGDKM